jgi:Holliday junction resolvase RusA-like endonuclease
MQDARPLTYLGGIDSRSANQSLELRQSLITEIAGAIEEEIMDNIDRKPIDIPTYKFEVRVLGFEPMSGSKGKGKQLAKKKELVKKITSKKSTEEIERAHADLYGKLVDVRARFSLWKGSEGYTNTSSKKDLDNLLKLVLDVLQPFADSERSTNGLNLIRSDEDVFRLEATKKIVNEREMAGLDLQISEYSERA